MSGDCPFLIPYGMFACLTDEFCGEDRGGGLGESLLANPFEEVKYLVADMATALKRPLEEFDAYDRSEGYVSSLAIPLIATVDPLLSEPRLSKPSIILVEWQAK